MNYYNELDLYTAEWLRNLIKEGLIPNGEVDTRSIIDVQPDDLRSFTQCHFFAGIAGWSLALKLAGWPSDKQIWTGSCPCQPFSVAGKGKGTADERHLWPHFFRLISVCHPAVVMGEQVAGKAGYDWLDGVRSNLESENYACEGVDISACAVNAPHIRQRLYWIAESMEHTNSTLIKRERIPGRVCEEYNITNGGGAYSDMGDADSEQLRGRHAGEPISTSSCDESEARQWKRVWLDAGADGDNFWHDAEWITGADGKTRRVKPRICLLANGIPARVGKLRAFGNAIVPQVAAEVIKSFMEVYDG